MLVIFGSGTTPSLLDAILERQPMLISVRTESALKCTAVGPAYPDRGERCPPRSRKIGIVILNW
jgi:hypothetical protein